MPPKNDDESLLKADLPFLHYYSKHEHKKVYALSNKFTFLSVIVFLWSLNNQPNYQWFLKGYCFDFDFGCTEMIYLKGQGWAEIWMIERLFNYMRDRRTWYNYWVLLIGSPIKEKRGGGFPPFQDVQHKAMVLMWAAGAFLPFSDDYDTKPLVQGFYWMANRSRAVGGLDPHNIRHRKGKRQIEGGFHRLKTKALAARFATLSPELDHSTRIPFETTSMIEDWLEPN